MKSDLRSLLHSKSFLLHFLPTAVVFIAFLSVTFWAYLSSVDALNREQQRVIDDKTKEIQSSISNRLTVYEQILRSSGRLFNASNDVTLDEWHTYISFENMSKRYPGIRSVGFAAAVKTEDLPTFIDRARMTVKPDYELQLSTDQQNLHTPILFITPKDEALQQGLGYDPFSDTVRREAIEKAVNSGQITITSKLELFQGRTSDNNATKSGFVMYVPVYSTTQPPLTPEERWDSFVGVVYGAFRSQDLFNGIFKGSSYENFDFRIYSNENQHDMLLYQSNNYEEVENSNDIIYSTKVLSHYGTTWLMDYHISPEIVSATVRDRPTAIFIAGLLLSTLTAGLVFTLLVARTRSLATLKEREVQSAKDDLLSLASHQLRTPATGVKQYIGMVLEGYAGTLKNEQRMYLEKAYESNERQLHIINELLYVAKADAGRIVLAKRSIRINELIKDVIAEQRQSAKDKDISLRVKLPSRDRLIIADKHCLRMAIENLLTNAIKYTPPGGKVKVGVSIEGKTLEISVKDTGVGVSDEDKSMLFSRFTRIPNKLSNSTSGSGIGLYLAYNLIQLHDGDITVESKTDKGSAFIIRMPLGLKK